MVTGLHSALSGLRAFSTKVENNANNIANINTEGFKRGRVLLSSQPAGGVGTRVERVTTPGPVIAETTDRGMEMIEQSNVNLEEEIPELIRNEHSYTANLKTVRVTDQMTRSLLDIKV